MAGKLSRVSVPLAWLTEKPDVNSRNGKHTSQLLYGEEFLIESEEKGWCYGTCRTDNYQGYIESEVLKPPASSTTDHVSAPWAHIFAAPAPNAPIAGGLGMMSRISPGNEDFGYIPVPGLGWILKDNLSDQPEPDFVKTALLFEGAPYLWGGRSAQGIDCSGLVQISLLRAGIKCERDSGEQEKTIGTLVEENIFRRGDIVFFKGHVGIMLDNTHILNATARTMDMRIEKISELEKIYKGITAVRRIPGYSPG